MLLFIILNLLNVIIQTVKSIVTIKCNKYIASTINAIAYGLYTYIVVLTANAGDITTLEKCVIVGGVNLIGVYIVKAMEEKTNKKRLYKLEVCTEFNKPLEKILKSLKISYNFIQNDSDNKYIFNIFTEDQKVIEGIKKLQKRLKFKMFIY